MCIVLEAVMIPGYKKKVRLPKVWYQQTQDTILFTYYFKGKMKWLELERGEDTAQFLLHHGKIKRYEGYGKNLKMYKHYTPDPTSEKETNIDWDLEVELEWKDIKFFNSDVIHFAAKYEYELKGRFLGLVDYKEPGKLRSFDFDKRPLPGQSKVIEMNTLRAA